MRLFIGGLAILIIGLGLGSFLSWVSVRDNQGFGALRVGPWLAWPYAGSAQADPYTTAKVAAEGNVPLGAAEGVVFIAETDTQNQPLQRQCRYRLNGKLPQARLWTLTAQDPKGAVVADRLGRPSVLVSSDVVWFEPRTLAVNIGEIHETGNWLAVDGTGPLQLVMRLYDSPVTSGAGISNIVLPEIRRVQCRG
jgi:hypothetical protein